MNLNKNKCNANKLLFLIFRRNTMNLSIMCQVVSHTRHRVHWHTAQTKQMYYSIQFDIN